ncbi:MAG: chorismate mutase [Hungatella sp.]|jgi:3-deoxy-7-phosphoheptulonate synthase/chorismate mutase|nr:chorismate mutase [Hungatella sp.]
MNEEIDRLRREIDHINIGILDLVNKRMDIVKKIAKIKNENNTEHFDEERENQMMEAVLKNNHGPLPHSLVKDIFSTILAVSLKFMGISHERRLLVSSGSAEAFPSIPEMFSLEGSRPVVIAGPCVIENPNIWKGLPGI